MISTENYAKRRETIYYNIETKSTPADIFQFSLTSFIELSMQVLKYVLERGLFNPLIPFILQYCTVQVFTVQQSYWLKILDKRPLTEQGTATRFHHHL